jgi:5-methylcytosine-specific restriction enzyme subunit McrC
VALREALEGAYGGRVAAEPLHHLDVAGRVRVYPDIVWHIGGLAVAVIDAKYKAEKPRGYPNADLYQMLAYCTVLGLSVGHLVYARGNEEPRRHVVRGVGVEVVCHALDLDQAPDSLLGEVRELAGAICGGSSTVRAHGTPDDASLRSIANWEAIAIGESQKALNRNDNSPYP